MTIAFAYPDVLTKKQWDKKKGVMAKLAIGKTDVGVLSQVTILRDGQEQTLEVRVTARPDQVN